MLALVIDNAAQVQIPYQHEQRDHRHSHRDLIRNHLRTRTNAAQEWIFGIGSVAREHNPNTPTYLIDAASSHAPSLEPRLRAVLDGVEMGESLGEIAARTGMSAPAVRSALGELEVAGLIVSGALGWYQRVARR